MRVAGQIVVALDEKLGALPELKTQLASVRGDIARYDSAFQDMSTLARTVGLDENHGLQGDLRTAVHDVETTLKTVDLPAAQIAMLMMRRHEKDFIARLDPHYGTDLKNAMPAFATRLMRRRCQPGSRVGFWRK